MKNWIMAMVAFGAVGLAGCGGEDEQIQEGFDTAPGVEGPAATTPGTTTPGAGPGAPGAPVGPGAQGTVGPGTGQDTTTLGTDSARGTGGSGL